jgi:hypothetical protein
MPGWPSATPGRLEWTFAHSEHTAGGPVDRNDAGRGAAGTPTADDHARERRSPRRCGTPVRDLTTEPPAY